MPHALMRWLRYRIERWIQRGIVGQLALAAALVAAVALAGGLLGWLLTDTFEGPAEAVWWAFLRLTDPGYLGDDHGVVLRLLSTAITVLGYVLFMGSLIAIMTQWLAQTIRRLESGLTPIVMHDHVVILGLTDRTPAVVTMLLGARGRLARFLERLDVGTLRFVILADEIDAARRQALREELGAHWDADRIVLRTGSSQKLEDLARLDLPRAAVVVVPGAHFEPGGADASDTRVLKTLITLEHLLAGREPAQRPLVVAELLDPLKVPVARRTLRGPLEIVASDVLISRLVTQGVRHPLVAGLLLELLSHGGSTFYLRGVPELAGTAPAALGGRFAHAVVIGLVRVERGRARAILNPDASVVLRADDLLAFVAPSYDACAPSDEGPAAAAPAPAATASSSASASTSTPAPPWASVSASARASASSATAEPGAAPAPRRVLVLGWSARFVTLLAEIGRTTRARYEVTFVSQVPRADRARALEHVHEDSERVRVHHEEADYVLPRDMRRVGPRAYDHVLMLSSARVETREEADARTLIGLVLLRSLLEGAPPPHPPVLVELLDPGNAALLASRGETLLLSPRIISHVLAHVALRPELNAVFAALFVTGGPDVELRGPAEYGLAGRTLTFAEIGRAARARGEVALGVLAGAPDGGLPASFELDQDAARVWTLGAGDHVVVLAG